MSLEQRGDAAVVTHSYARHVLTDLRSASTEQVDFRRGLVRLGRICGYELIDGRFETREIRVRTPLTETDGEGIEGLDDVVIVNVLRAATPFVEGLLGVFPAARQGVVSASRDEDAGMTDGAFPIALDYVKLPEVRAEDTVIVADPMLATGSTMCGVLAELLADGPRPEQVIVLAAVAAPEGVARLAAEFPDVDLVTVAIDDGLDDEGFIRPGLGDAGDRAFGTTQ